jgi:glucose-6-phosphate 1-dehydrogenase
MSKALFYIFGGTGDLSFKKLYPAFYALYKKEDMPDYFKIIVVGRRSLSTCDVQKLIGESLEKYSKGIEVDSERIQEFLNHFIYFKMDFDEKERYVALNEFSHELCSDSDVGKIVYLATAPTYFEIISSHLANANLLVKGNINHRIVIEKPFGKDLLSAAQIDNAIQDNLEMLQIYRMDHYLGKSMIQNLMILRFSNAIFEAAWNREYIDHVQITVAENTGVGDRGGYYDHSGAIRDMIQSHLLQIVALMTMDEPKSLSYDDLANEKVKVFQAMRVENIETDLLLGQYIGNDVQKGYLSENGIAPNSCTETFVALKMQIENQRWQGVDFFLRTGKHLKRRVAEVTIFYKNKLPFIKYANAPQNKLTIRIQPDEGTTFHFNLMEPSNEKSIVEREMDFCQSCILVEDSPEAYEKLIFDVIQGDRTLYTRWDELEASWQFVDQMLMTCSDRKPYLYPYEIGSWGPVEARNLMSDNRAWVEGD